MDVNRSADARLVSVCIPTCRRPQLLIDCLNGVLLQETVGFRIEVVVVDNDPRCSARAAFEEWSGQTALDTRYVSEPRPNIALARNAALTHARGDWIAFVDDDEVPERRWIESLLRCAEACQADGVLGPVLPRFIPPAPQWLMDSGLCSRKNFPTGTPLTDSRQMRTGNVLLHRRLFDAEPAPFDPRFGLTGGEDAVFFRRKLEQGGRFVWCDEARVHEVVPAERQRLGYHIHRALLRGVSEADSVPFLTLATLKSIIAIPVYAMLLPSLAVVSFPRFARYLVKLADHAGKLAAYVGLRPVKERPSAHPTDQVN